MNNCSFCFALSLVSSSLVFLDSPPSSVWHSLGHFARLPLSLLPPSLARSFSSRSTYSSLVPSSSSNSLLCFRELSFHQPSGCSQRYRSSLASLALTLTYLERSFRKDGGGGLYAYFYSFLLSFSLARPRRDGLGSLFDRGEVEERESERERATPVSAFPSFPSLCGYSLPSEAQSLSECMSAFFSFPLTRQCTLCLLFFTALFWRPEMSPLLSFPSLASSLDLRPRKKEESEKMCSAPFSARRQPFRPRKKRCDLCPLACFTLQPR